MIRPHHSIPDHAPLQPCPFCGRGASVGAHQAAPDQKVIYSVGCFRDPDPFARQPFWDDCLGPQSSPTVYVDEAARLWNCRAGHAARVI